MLIINEVSKTFNTGTVDAHKALNNLSVHIKKEDFVTIVGGNGAGKSSLFNVISGNFLPDCGQIILDGQDITFLPEYKRAKRIGRIFQDPLKGTAPHLTVEENLSIAYMRSKGRNILTSVSRADKAFLRQRLSELNLGLEDRMNTKIGLLSGGQRQAITLTMATLVTPKLLLLDEHTAALDPISAEQVMSLTRKIVQEHKITTLMITHNISSAIATGNRVIMLDNGEVAVDIEGQERQKLTSESLLSKYSQARKKSFDSDRALL